MSRSPQKQKNYTGQTGVGLVPSDFYLNNEFNLDRRVSRTPAPVGRTKNSSRNNNTKDNKSHDTWSAQIERTRVVS